MVESRDGLKRLKKALEAYPIIWFDNNTMAFLINQDRKTISRNRDRLRKSGFIHERGRYFRLFVSNL